MVTNVTELTMAQLLYVAATALDPVFGEHSNADIAALLPSLRREMSDRAASIEGLATALETQPVPQGWTVHPSLALNRPYLCRDIDAWMKEHV